MSLVASLVLSVVLAQSPEQAVTALGGAKGTAKKGSVLVLPVRTQGEVQPHLADVTAEMIATTLRKAPSLTVMTFAEVEELLTQEQRKMVAGCTSESCATEIAGALNASEVLRATLGRLGDSYVITITRIAAAEAKAIGSVARQFDATDEEAISALIPDALAELFPQAKELRSFRISRASSATARVGANRDPAEAEGGGGVLGRTFTTTLRLAGSFGVFAAVVGALASLGVITGAGTVLLVYVINFQIPAVLDPPSATRHSAAEIERYRLMGTGGTLGLVVGLASGLVALVVGAVGVAMVASTFVMSTASE
ncbi:MAG: hypothetical protein AB2A00_04300 [Myxococcota bacterium]